jgi:hypothetical protein
LDCTIEDFHRQMSTIWHCLDDLGVLSFALLILVSAVSAIGARETLCLHEFLSWLYPEFKTVRVQLLTRCPRPSLAEAMPELRSKETHLRTAGVSSIQQQPSVLASMPSTCLRCRCYLPCHLSPRLWQRLLLRVFFVATVNGWVMMSGLSTRRSTTKRPKVNAIL